MRESSFCLSASGAGGCDDDDGGGGWCVCVERQKHN
jgi:hypothetical protein